MFKGVLTLTGGLSSIAPLPPPATAASAERHSVIAVEAAAVLLHQALIEVEHTLNSHASPDAWRAYAALVEAAEKLLEQGAAAERGDAWRRLGPRVQAAAHALRARQAGVEGDVEGVSSHCSRALRCRVANPSPNPSHEEEEVPGGVLALPHLLLAKARFQDGDWEGALEAFNAAGARVANPSIATQAGGGAGQVALLEQALQHLVSLIVTLRPWVAAT